MSQFTAYHLRFEGRAESTILLGEHPGAALRGALLHALRGTPGQPGFCLEPGRQECRGCPVVSNCPVSFLLSTVDEAGRRGADVPRPYTIEPPLTSSGKYQPGQPFQFGLTMFARALPLFPYVIVAARRIEEAGIGREWPDEGGRWQRGRFRIDRIRATNPLTGEEQVVLQRGDELVKVPNLPVTHAQVLSRARALEGKGSFTLEFLTPTRLIDDGRPLRRPVFRALTQRLLERLSSLWEEYGQEQLPIDFGTVMSQADKIKLVDDQMRWVEVRGYSTRQDAPKYLNGFVGRAVYEGEAGLVLPWLVWGEHVHVGKDAVKGCGLYRIVDGA